jgi:hypothetical protein
MPEIGTSGSTSGDGKRRVAAWPKRPRPSSTLPKRTYRDVCHSYAFGGKADLASATGEVAAPPSFPQPVFLDYPFDAVSVHLRTTQRRLSAPPQIGATFTKSEQVRRSYFLHRH